MKIKAVLFDLDGTLLSMDQDLFISEYISAIAAYLAPHGYDPRLFAKALWKGTAAMVKNDGQALNESVFWSVFSSLFPDRSIEEDKPLFDEFYVKKFDSIKDKVAKHDPMARAAMDRIKERGLRTILATNPLFPSIATEKRIAWAGFSPTEFEFFTSYENSYHSKPNPDYYRAVCKKAGLLPEECLMVGNDVGDDMIAESLGMKVFLLTDNLINSSSADISVYPGGGFADLIKFIDTL
ncbi:MAG: HAD family hydrolase [Clostridia bacterium]|nr:HAD family hydrolase [Clostridia bacterium]